MDDKGKATDAVTAALSAERDFIDRETCRTFDEPAATEERSFETEPNAEYVQTDPFFDLQGNVYRAWPESGDQALGVVRADGKRFDGSPITFEAKFGYEGGPPDLVKMTNLILAGIELGDDPRAYKSVGIESDAQDSTKIKNQLLDRYLWSYKLER